VFGRGPSSSASQGWFCFGHCLCIRGATYRAHARVLVRRGRADPPVTAQQNAPPDFSRVEVSEEELNSEVELLKDNMCCVE